MNCALPESAAVVGCISKSSVGRRSLRRAVALTIALWAVYASSAQATTTVIGGNDLLTSASAQQLSDWLGAGPIALTNIYDKRSGDIASDFHAAVDGKGATISLLEITQVGEVDLATPLLIGGYNPLSWATFGNFNYSPSNEQRTAFIFNLTALTKFEQKLYDFNPEFADRGIYQTYNSLNVGPAFGGGYDLHVDNGLTSGYSQGYSYGTSLVNIIDGGLSPMSFAVGKIEVFAIAPQTVMAAIPEPETYALLLAGLAGIGVTAKRKRAAAHA